MKRGQAVTRVLLLLIACVWLAAAAGPGCRASEPAVHVKFARHAQTPADASVIVDEEYVGPLYFVVARGLRLPPGQHRITVQKPGYFPWDRLVVATGQPIELSVELVAIPD